MINKYYGLYWLKLYKEKKREVVIYVLVIGNVVWIKPFESI